MKKVLTLIAIVALSAILNSAIAEETTCQEKSGNFFQKVSDKTQETAEFTADSVKMGTKKAGHFFRDTTKVIGHKTAENAKKGADIAKDATVRGANKVSNSTAKGMKKAAEKMQSSADRTIERTDKALEETAPKKKCNCNCGCGENCDCAKSSNYCE